MTNSNALTPARFDHAQGTLAVHSPIDGALLARVVETAPGAMPAVIDRAQTAFGAWRQVPAPRRGELVRLLGEELRAAKAELGALVTREGAHLVFQIFGELPREPRRDSLGTRAPHQIGAVTGLTGRR